jgi:hypothetical protein
VTYAERVTILTFGQGRTASMDLGWTAKGKQYLRESAIGAYRLLAAEYPTSNHVAFSRT